MVIPNSSILTFLFIVYHLRYHASMDERDEIQEKTLANEVWKEAGRLGTAGWEVSLLMYYCP